LTRGGEDGVRRRERGTRDEPRREEGKGKDGKGEACFGCGFYFFIGLVSITKKI
jgi:hypothetical protein